MMLQLDLFFEGQKIIISTGSRIGYGDVRGIYKYTTDVLIDVSFDNELAIHRIYMDGVGDENWILPY